MALKPTNNPIEVMRRETAQLNREAQVALEAGGTQPFQAVRKLRAQIDELRELVVRLPQNEGRQVDVEDFTPSSDWATIAQTVIPRPADKTRVVVSATGYVTAVAPGDYLGFRSRIVINGAASTLFEGSVEGSSFLTRSVTYPSFMREIAPLTASNVTVQLQISVASQYTNARKASLSVLAGFSTI